MNLQQRSKALYAIREFATIVKFFVDAEGTGYCALGAMAKFAGMTNEQMRFPASDSPEDMFRIYDFISQAYGINRQICHNIASVNNANPSTHLRQIDLENYIMSLPLETESPLAKLIQEALAG